MTTKERLSKRKELLIDLGCMVDEVNDMIYVTYNRKLDCSITWLKYMNKAKFTTLLEFTQEAYIKHNTTKTN